MKAGELLSPWIKPQAYWQDIDIKGLQLDSRLIQKGDLFLAYAGTQSHGLHYVQQAVARGAALVLSEPCSSCNAELIRLLAQQVPVLFLDRLRCQISAIAGRFYEHPSHDLRLIGITGTNGKSSIAYFLAQALAPYYRIAITGTLGNGFLPELQASSHTTADAVQAQRLLAAYRQQGAQAVAMEVSSHALDQCRLQALRFHTAVFTQLSHDHLDYHGSMLAYARAKRKLFDYPDLEWAVINHDDPIGASWIDDLNCKPIICTHQSHRSSRHFVHLQSFEQNESGLHLNLQTSWGDLSCQTRLFGAFHAQNLMLVAGVLFAWGLDEQQVARALSDLQPVPGRMQALGGGQQPRVIIDYAHTPDALQAVLLSLRQQRPRKIHCVFGCGGDRDRTKRSRMGRIAQSLADEVILTDDNPRSESSASIIADILAGMEKSQRVQVIVPREKAIAQAIAQAQADEIVLIAGKGHENYQIIGEQRLPFSDLEQAQSALSHYHDSI